MAHFYFKNFGQTPAHDVEMFGNAEIVPWPLMPETFPDIDWGREQSRPIIGPGGVRKKIEVFTQPHLVSAEEYNGSANRHARRDFFRERFDISTHSAKIGYSEETLAHDYFAAGYEMCARRHRAFIARQSVIIRRRPRASFEGKPRG